MMTDTTIWDFAEDGKYDLPSKKRLPARFMAPTISSTAAQRNRKSPPSKKVSASKISSRTSMAATRASSWVASAAARVGIRRSSNGKDFLKKRSFLRRKSQAASIRIISTDSLPRITRSPPSLRSSLRQKGKKSVPLIPGNKISPKSLNKKLPVLPSEKPLPQAPSDPDSIGHQSCSLVDAHKPHLEQPSQNSKKRMKNQPALFLSENKSSTSSEEIDPTPTRMGRNNPFNRTNLSQGRMDKFAAAVERNGFQKQSTSKILPVKSSLPISVAKDGLSRTKVRNGTSSTSDLSVPMEKAVPVRRVVTTSSAASSLPRRKISTTLPSMRGRRTSASGTFSGKNSSTAQLVYSPSTTPPSEELMYPRQTRTSLLRAEMHSPSNRNAQLSTNNGDDKTRRYSNGRGETARKTSSGALQEAHAQSTKKAGTPPEVYQVPQSFLKLRTADGSLQDTKARTVMPFSHNSDSSIRQIKERSMSEKRRQKMLDRASGSQRSYMTSSRVSDGSTLPSNISGQFSDLTVKELPSPPHRSAELKPEIHKNILSCLSTADSSLEGSGVLRDESIFTTEMQDKEMENATRIAMETLEMGQEKNNLPRSGYFIGLARALADTVEMANKARMHLERAKIEVSSAAVEQALCIQKVGQVSREIMQIRGVVATEGRHSW